MKDLDQPSLELIVQSHRLNKKIVKQDTLTVRLFQTQTRTQAVYEDKKAFIQKKRQAIRR